jgi:CBS domain containing-hemolysin-like protein
MDVPVHVLLILVCLTLSAFFSGSETALLRLRNHEVDVDAKASLTPGAPAARGLLQSTSHLLVTLLLGNNLVNILGAAIASALAIYFLGERAGSAAIASALAIYFLGERAGILAATLTMTVLVLIFCEVLPKAVAARHPRRISYVVALPLYLLHQALRPLHILFDRLIEPVVARVAGGGARELGTLPEDILRLARKALESEPDSQPLAIIGATAGAANMRVEEIMTPRTEIVAFPCDTASAELLEKVLDERYTRVPVYEGSIDRVLGVIHLKDLVKLVRENGGDLHSILKPVLRVPARKKILALLQDMQRGFVHLAIVKDEFDTTLGVVTQEDILEELVGEIRDEFDQEELLTIRCLPDSSYRSLGRIKVLDFNRQTGWNVPAESGDTLSGLVFNLLGRSPRRDDVVSVQGYELSVADLSGTRVTEVRVAQRADEKTEEG